MKSEQIVWILGLWLLTAPVTAQHGLKGEYFVGTNFERKVGSRIDPSIRFDWSEGSPAPIIPHSYYSVRWTGKLLPPATGEYRFYANVDDGIRVWVGDQKVMDSWQLNDSQKFTGSIRLESGRLYDLRVDYFNDMLGGKIDLYWQRPDDKKIRNPLSTPGEPISAQYFFRTTAPVAVPKKLAKPITIPAKPVIVSTPPTAIPKRRPATAAPKSALGPPPKQTPVIDTAMVASVPASKPKPEPVTDIKPGVPFILHHVLFEQSSYQLLPESSVELDKLVSTLKHNPDWRVDVAGHTDNVGDARLNLALSENRAKVVTNYLIRHGIDDDRLTATGYGGTRPIADNTTEGERRKNRRVEITIR